MQVLWSRAVPALCAVLPVLLWPAIASAQQAGMVLAIGTITSDNYPGQEFAGNGLSEAIPPAYTEHIGRAYLAASTTLGAVA